MHSKCVFSFLSTLKHVHGCPVVSQPPPVLSKNIMFRWTLLLSLKADCIPGPLFIISSCHSALINNVHKIPHDDLGLRVWVISSLGSQQLYTLTQLQLHQRLASDLNSNPLCYSGLFSHVHHPSSSNTLLSTLLTNFWHFCPWKVLEISLSPGYHLPDSMD